MAERRGVSRSLAAAVVVLTFVAFSSARADAANTKLAVSGAGLGGASFDFFCSFEAHGAYASTGQLGSGTYQLLGTWPPSPGACTQGPATGTASLTRSDGAHLTGTFSGNVLFPGAGQVRVVLNSGTRDLLSGDLNVTLQIQNTNIIPDGEAGTSVMFFTGSVAVGERIGYRILSTSGHVVALGGLDRFGDASTLCARQIVATPSDLGYWIATCSGAVFNFGDARALGSTGALRLRAPIVGMAAMPDGGGYWLVGADGGVFTFGNARYHGSTGALRLRAPIVGMAATADGGGYWLVGADGGVFTFGNARFLGSTGALQLRRPISGITRYGAGYLLVGSDGGVFDFSVFPFFGSLAGSVPAGSVAAIAGT